jgi:hypothetical protein
MNALLRVAGLWVVTNGPNATARAAHGQRRIQPSSTVRAASYPYAQHSDKKQVKVLFLDYAGPNSLERKPST